MSTESHIHTHAVPSVAAADKSQPCFPLFIANDGYSKADGDGEATASCFCGAVQLAFPTQGPGYRGAFVCHCTDCRKITASMFATNFTVADSHLKHLRGQETLKTFGQSHTIGSPRNGNLMTNHFCSNCGTLMYRVGSGFPGTVFMRVGTVDDFSLHETRLKPSVEIFVKDRVGWLKPVEGMEQALIRSLHGVTSGLVIGSSQEEISRI